MGCGAQHSYYHLNKCKEEGWRRSVSDVEWVELVQRICQSVDYGDLVTSSGVISMFVGRGKVSAGTNVPGDTVRCEQLQRKRFLGCGAEQGDDKQCSFGKDFCGDETDGASAKKGRRRSLARDASSAEPSRRWQDETMRAADWTRSWVLQ